MRVLPGCAGMVGKKIATRTQDPSSIMYYGWNVAAPASNVMMVESAAYALV